MSDMNAELFSVHIQMLSVSSELQNNNNNIGIV
jgi:hypothetical protein